MDCDLEVRALLRRGFVSSVFQPIVDLETGCHWGYEGLMRGPKGTPLESPLLVFGPASPLQQETVLELDRACMAAVLRAGHQLARETALFINVELATLLQGRSVLGMYQRLVESSGVAPSRVVLELSERATTVDPLPLARTLKFLRKRFGLRVALDDFGSAYSGLQHLLWFEPEFIKLDMGLVNGIGASFRKRCVVRHSVAMAREIGCSVIAEGVDSQEDLVALMDAGVLFAQGYHFGRPMEAAHWWHLDRQPEGFLPWFHARCALDESRPA